MQVIHAYMIIEAIAWTRDIYAVRTPNYVLCIMLLYPKNDTLVHVQDAFNDTCIICCMAHFKLSMHAHYIAQQVTH